MVDEDRYCIDIVTQISAVRAALRRVEEEVLRDHVVALRRARDRSGNKADQRQKIAELMAVIGRADQVIQVTVVTMHLLPSEALFLSFGPYGR